MKKSKFNKLLHVTCIIHFIKIILVYVVITKNTMYCFVNQLLLICQPLSYKFYNKYNLIIFNSLSFYLHYIFFYNLIIAGALFSLYKNYIFLQ